MDGVAKFCTPVGPAGSSGRDFWRCREMMTEYSEGRATASHWCAAPYDHEGDHHCLLGHTWPQTKPRRTLRERFRAMLTS